MIVERIDIMLISGLNKAYKVHNPDLKEAHYATSTSVNAIGLFQQ